MLSRFFVSRPIFAWVIAIVIMLAGALAINTLPVSQYPNIAPPQITVSAHYPGASAETLSKTVTQVIEQNMTGLDGLIYMDSTSDSTGRMSIHLTFIAGTNPDMAQVQVQNKLSRVETMLPDVVRKLGVVVEKTMPSFLMAAAFIDKTGRLGNGDLGDFITNKLKEPIARLPGVGQVTVFGASYAMRVWLDPEKLYKYGLQPTDVINAISSQNVQVAAGDVGAPPVNQNRMITATIKANSLMQTPAEFENIALKTRNDGSVVKLKDVATVAIGEENSQFSSYYQEHEASGMAVSLAAGANALKVAQSVRDKLQELSPFFPEGVEVLYPGDTTLFVKEAMYEVIKTLIEAIVLVVVVMYLFLQNWRATLIPTVAVPVVLLGTIAVLGAMGYTINMLTMFGLVLAIGLLVDDAIVVVENVERVMVEDKTEAKIATVKSMNQITGALIGIAMVLSAVFVPMAFFGGSTGVIYRQFTVTIVSAMVLSVIVALTLTPALCASTLKQKTGEGDMNEKRGFFGAFNRGFRKMSNAVRNVVRVMTVKSAVLLTLYAAIIGGVAYGFVYLPKSFMPQEDQGALLFLTQTPPSATAERTDRALNRMRSVLAEQEKEGVEALFSVRGFSFAGTGQNTGFGFIKLRDWGLRKSASQSMQAIQGRMQGRVFAPDFNDMLTFVFPLPPVPELGVAEGFDFYLEDRAGFGHDRLTEVANEFLAIANKDPRLMQVRINGMPDQPMLDLKVDYEKARALGVDDSAINATINTAFGSTYVNNFIDQDRIKKVYVQGKADARGEVEDINRWHVRGANGQMVPFSAFATVEWSFGAARLARFNALNAVNIQGAPAPGFSTGQAMEVIEEIMGKMPPGFSIEWNAVSYQERAASGNASSLYAISLLVVFLALAALYESWSIPVAVILVVPTGILGALALTALTGRENDVYFQVGLLTTVGLVAKNAILIVEFARDLYDGGMDVLEAVVEAVRLRLRPILMTSIAFGLGVLPLAMAHGAGAGAQSAIGIAVLGGMMTGTFLCVVFVPVFFVLINRIFGRKKVETIDINEVTQNA